ncbi:hypothetical protein OG589_38395 [Sphaerisporangium sp. NBC_01403]
MTAPNRCHAEACGSIGSAAMTPLVIVVRRIEVTDEGAQTMPSTPP